MVCLDAGANMGLISLRLGRRVGPTGAVHSFEPVPYVFDRLTQHVQRKRLQEVVRTHRVALSNRTGSAQMGVTDSQEENQGMGSLVRLTDLSQRISVETMTLDDFAQRAHFDRLDFVKLDIQGAETFFLAGGERTLRRFKPLMVVELSPEDLAGAGKTSKDLMAQIDALGYEVYELGPKGEAGRRLRGQHPPRISRIRACSVMPPQLTDPAP
jgi:FkbM family methyltransferase